MIRRLRALWDDLRELGDPFAIDFDDLDQAAVPTGPLASLPVEVRRLVHTVDHMRDRWADADDARRRELWTAVHTACDAVWEVADRG